MLNQRVFERRHLIRSAIVGRILIAPLFAAFVIMLESCATMDVDRIQYAGAPHLPPSDPGLVKILREEPKQPNERLGEVVVDASTDPSPAISDVEARLRKEGGKLGADAVVIVYDSIQRTVYVLSPWWSGAPSTRDARRLIGVAIKYQEKAEAGPG